MQYLRGWRALRQDPDWLRKIGIACLLLMVPFVGGIVVTGWTSLMVRRAVSGQDAPLPRLDLDMDYLGKLLSIGFKAFLARMLWSLPLTALSMAMGCCMYIGMFGFAFAAAGSNGGSEEMGIGFACVMLGFMMAFFGVMVVAAMPVSIGVLSAEITDDLNAAMRWKDVLRMTRMLAKELILGQLVFFPLVMIAMTISICTLYLGLLPSMVVLQIIGTYWLAEVYQAYLQKGGEPLPVGPLDVPPPTVQQYPGQHPPQHP